MRYRLTLEKSIKYNILVLGIFHHEAGESMQMEKWSIHLERDTYVYVCPK